MARELIDLRGIESRLAAGLGQRLPWAGLAFAAGFTLGSEALSRLIDAEWCVGCALSVGTVICFAIGMALARPLCRRPRYHVSVTSERAGPCRWLIVAASGGAAGAGSPAGRAIAWQARAGSLERVHVLYTDNEMGRSFYDLVRREAIDAGLKPEQIRPLRLPAMARWDPDMIAPAIEEVYRDAAEAGLDESELLVDYTGGSVSFTAAMTLIAARGGRRLAQIRPERLAVQGQPDPDASWTQMEVDLVLSLAR